MLADRGLLDSVLSLVPGYADKAALQWRSDVQLATRYQPAHLDSETFYEPDKNETSQSIKVINKEIIENARKRTLRRNSPSKKRKKESSR